jgi:hypothetical protein
MLLEFNPYFRPTARELLKHSLFDDIRIKENEVSADYKIIIEIDNKYPQNYQYGHSSKVIEEIMNECKIDLLREVLKLQRQTDITEEDR